VLDVLERLDPSPSDAHATACVYGLCCQQTCMPCPTLPADDVVLFGLIPIQYLCCCRITPDGCKPVSGSSPTAAWQELYKAAAGSTVSGASAAAAASVCGAKLFGLQHPVVLALVQALPHAAACDRFMAWQGEPPEPVMLVRAK
jgi:hypothetical protein